MPNHAHDQLICDKHIFETTLILHIISKGPFNNYVIKF